MAFPGGLGRTRTADLVLTKHVHCQLCYETMAEREGLEPSHRLAATYRFSKPAPSPTWVPLQKKMEHLVRFERTWSITSLAYKASAIGHYATGASIKATFLNQLSKIADVCDVCCQSPYYVIGARIPIL